MFASDHSMVLAKQMQRLSRLRVSSPHSPRPRRLSVFCAAALVSVAGACSSGSSSGGGGDSGDLSARVLWEQRDEPAATSGVQSQGGFGTDLPAAARTVSFTFSPQGGDACCVAVDPRQIPIDPSIGQRRVVLKRLPVGAGTLTIAAFAGNSAAAPAGASTTCEIEPAAAAMSCVRGLVDTPSFQSAPQPVDVAGGAEVDAGDIEVPALPFVLPGSLDPEPDGVVDSPLQVRASIVIAAGSVGSDSIGITLSPGGEQDFSAAACDDAGANPCSEGGALDVSGFAVESAPAALPLGDTDAEIRAASASSGTSLRLTYSFEIVSEAPTATQTTGPSSTPTRTGTRAPTNTPAPTRTPRPPTATRAPRTPTRTFTPFVTPTGPTASPTNTPNAMCGSAPRPQCRRTTAAQQSLLVLNRAGAGADDNRLIFRWESGDFTQVRDFGDPGLNTSYAICLYDEEQNVPFLLRQWFVPPGPDCPGTGCWRTTDDGWRYSDVSASRDGITVIDLNAGLPGRANIRVTGEGAGIALPTLPLMQDQHVIVQVINDFEAGECWEESFRLPAIRNIATEFRDGGDGPVP